ncbi:MAG: SusF/SusE family outer membrane protein [Bacteroidota bacterium]
MKNLFFILITGLLLFAGCDREEIDIPSNTDFPPAILSSFPSANSRVVREAFDVKVIFADGSTSPLASATVTLFDAGGAELISQTSSLQGTSDSLIIPAADFNPQDLPIADYEMTISVSDTKGQMTETRFAFTLSSLPFAANHEEMYIAGAFNGWGADTMRLVDDHIWEVSGVDLDNQGWKFKNCFDWCDEDWGDGDCDGFMTSNSVGNDNTECGDGGMAVIRFNDMTLSYSVSPLVTLESNITGLFLLGSFNDFEGNDFQFSLVDDNTWVVEEVLIAPGDRYKFAEMPDLMGTIYGDNEGDGVAEAFGSNIVFGGDQEAFYRFTFNDETLEYSSEFVRLPSIGIIGSATPGGWDTDTDMDDSDGDGVFNIIITLTDGEVKFRANDEWDVNWGGTGFPSGAAEPNSNDNIPVVAGLYQVTLNTNDLTYNFAEITTIGVIGDATPGGWDSDTDLERQDDGLWFARVTLTDGEAKFRANDAWDISWGATDFPGGTGSTNNGPNIPVTAGTYDITINPETGEYNFGPEGSYGDNGFNSVGIIGDATPGGWDNDTDMMDNGDGTYSLLIGLAGGQVKFRANDLWDDNWGGTDFPSGSAVFNSNDNIPVTAGLYMVTLDLNNETYSFEPATLGIIGDATPGGWDNDTDMTFDVNSPNLLELDITLTDGQVKFRINDVWDILNWGGTDFPSGTGVVNSGDNIPVTAGDYTVQFNVLTYEYNFIQ